MNGVAAGLTVRLGLNSSFERLYERRRRWFTRPFVPGVWAKNTHFPGGIPGAADGFARSFSLNKPNYKGRPSRDGPELKNSINIS